MELDKTSIVLRQRSLLELIDFSLIVLRNYWQPCIAIGLLGALPFMVINFFVLRPLSDYESLMTINYEIVTEGPLRMRFLAYTFGLILIEAPLAFLGVTYFLGQAVFFERPSMRTFGAVISQMGLAIAWSLGILRMGLWAWLIVGIVSWSAEWNLGFEFLFVGLILGGGSMLLRAFRPFATELLVLERTPLFVKQKGGSESSMSYRRRSRWLHRPISGELFGRYLTMSMSMLCLLVSLSLGELFVIGTFFGNWTWGWWMEWFLFPLNVWFVALWGSIFRLLSYLDARTRLEGWELELRLKAEATRLQGGAA